MFGHDDNSQTTDAATQAAAPGSGLGASASNMDITTAGAGVDAGSAGFGGAPGTLPAPSDPQATSDLDAAAPVAAAAPAHLGAGVDSDELLQIKQQALQQLSPLVGHLEQTPEEKFRTTMMMIQASDNQDLIKEAYAAAQAIEDEKARAQALLDIINEINYFTQQGQQS